MSGTTPVHSVIQRQGLKEAQLSFAQESLWFQQLLEPENTQYNSSHLVKFSGSLDHSALEKAVNEMVRRHESLRTIYTNREGPPFQVVQPYEAFDMPLIDLSGLVDADREQAVLEYKNKQSNQPFNLQTGPVIRFVLLHLSPSVDYLSFCVHHIAFDAWSREIFFDELAQLYNAFSSGTTPSLPEMKFQYIDYAVWQKDWLQGVTLKNYVQHWKNDLSGDLPVLELPTDRQRPTNPTFHGARFAIALTQALSSDMVEFCKKERLTQFQLVMAAYALLLMRHTGQEDIIVGCPFANRPRTELENMVGLFVNTLPVRVRLPERVNVREYLQKVKQLLLEGYQWQAAPFEVLLSEISPERENLRTPLFRAVINLRNVPKRQTHFNGVQTENLPRENLPEMVDLSFELERHDDGGLSGVFEYNADLFDEATIAGMANHYVRLLEEMLAYPEGSVTDLEILSPEEYRQIVMDWNTTEAEIPQGRIQDLIRSRVEKDPGALAVVYNGMKLSYGELEEKANRLANFLQANGVGAGDRVGVFTQLSSMSPVAELAILKAGGTFVVLDLLFPDERISYILKESCPAAVITMSDLCSRLPEQVRKICLDSDWSSIESFGAENPSSATTQDAAACIMYTSGSTGQPKGALNTHRGLINYYTHMIRVFHFGPGDHMIQCSPLSFDPSLLTILGTMTFGGTLYLLDDIQLRDPAAVISAIIEHKGTYIFTSPTMLRDICEFYLAQGMRGISLRLISVGGEVFQTSDLDLVRRVFGKATLVNNEYGPTECSISCTHFLIPEDFPAEAEGIPIGRPISNVRNYILDKYFHPVPQGVPGEMYVAGAGVGLGYLNRHDLTTERFLPDPFWPGSKMYRTGDVVRQLRDGSICFIDRLDNQVKIRGYRVELGEIEAVIHEYPGVKDAAVILKHLDGREFLAAYITPTNDQTENIVMGLKDSLVGRLPFYMLPSSINVLKEMPLTSSLKVDRRALAKYEIQESERVYTGPRNEIESQLASIWEEFLEVKPIGIRDNFFELGGDSLMAVQMYSRIRIRFGQSLPLLLMFKEGTIESLAKELIHQREAGKGNAVLTIRSEGGGNPLFFVIPFLGPRRLAYAMPPGRPIYGLYPVENGEITYRKSVQETSEILYRILVEQFPEGPYQLIGHSALGYFTLELARLLMARGKKVIFIGLLDTFPPGQKNELPFPELVAYHLDQLKKMTSGRVCYFFGRARNLSNRFRRNATNTREFKQYAGEKRTTNAREQASRAYRPEPFDGNVTLFIASERKYYAKWDPMNKWKKIITGQIETVFIHGGHFNMFKPPNVDQLAEKIEEAMLHQVEERNQGV